MALSGWDHETSPYHSGEQELHARLGRKEHQESTARRIHRTFMPDQHRDFFAELPFMVVGSVDTQGWPWASMLFGKPGFIETPDDRTLKIETTILSGDPLGNNIHKGSPLGFVGIELPTRRRNRVNGVVTTSNENAFEVKVSQSFGNCPQYIQTREMEFIRDPKEKTDIKTEAFTTLSEQAVQAIKKADTLFVASNNHQDDKYITGGSDVNHRGGKPGFVKVEGNVLTIPDYIGNFAFNTLGNFMINPKAGLMFVDFDSGDIWQMTGTVKLLWDGNEEIHAFKGAERAWQFHLDHGMLLKQATPLRWKMGEMSPNVMLTGDWNEAERTLAAEKNRNAWRKFHVSEIEDESSVIRSFYLKPADGIGKLDYLPGQYLTLRVKLKDDEQAIRTYTLSSAPSDNYYQISVKREADGRVSNHLHDNLKQGDVIEVRAPNGSFSMDMQEERPAVLIAAGVGITPMIAMAREALRNAVRNRHLRSITIFHAAKTTQERAFARDFIALQHAANGSLRYISLIENPGKLEEAGKEFHLEGRLTPKILQRSLPLADYDFYLCGPPAFMQVVYDMLVELGVRDGRIFAESFGPASLVRSHEGLLTNKDCPEAATSAVVTFEKSMIEQAWMKGDSTLLEFAEAHGLSPQYGCKSGACGSCAVKLLSGKVSYVQKPTFQHKEDEVLICCAVPAAGDEKLIIDL